MRSLSDVILDTCVNRSGNVCIAITHEHIDRIANAVQMWISSKNWYQMPERLPGGTEARQRTAARLWTMRKQQRHLMAKYVSIADVYTDGNGTPFSELQRKDMEERRQAVQEVREWHM